MKKKISLIIVILLNYFSGYSQHWQWAVGAGSESDDYAISVCHDEEGNIYVTGEVYYFTAYFQTDTFEVNGLNDIFLAKYDANGNEKWVKVFGGPYFNDNNIVKLEEPKKVVYNPISNSILLTGYFIGDCTIDTFHLTAHGSDDQEIFLAKFDLNGNCLWAKSAGGTHGDYVWGLDAVLSGDIYVTGFVNSTATFDSFTFPAGCFLAKYDDNGNCKWVKNIFQNPSTGSFGGGVPIDLKSYQNDLFFMGLKMAYADSIYVDTILFVDTNETTILARFDSSGNVKWAKQLQTPVNRIYTTFAVDSSGNCYFTSTYQGNYAVFEDDTVFAEFDTTNYFRNFYIVKYNKNGELKWIKQISSTYGLLIRGNSIDGNMNIYLSGCISDTTKFGPYYVIANKSKDLFVSKYDTNGNCLGVAHAGGAEAYDVSVTPEGQCYVAGGYSGTIQFDNSISLTSNGGEDVFLAKIDKVEGVIKNPIVKKPDNGQIIIYPNPATGTVTIWCSKDLLGSQVEITDINGKSVLQTKINTDRTTINISRLTKGVYFVKIKSKNGVGVKKLVVN